MKNTTEHSTLTSPIKLIQITDTHLYAEADGMLLGVNTRDSFHAVVDAITQAEFDYDAILATGDISQDHSEISYTEFESGIVPLEKPCYWLPGNHDYQPNMSSVMPSDQIQPVSHALLGQHWQIVLLDSQVVGVPYGRLSEQQLNFLDSVLTKYSSRHSLVILHHHPVLAGSAWLDHHTLKNDDDLWQVLDKHSNVKALLCGHIHQDLNLNHNGVQVMASPSTCVQFKPNSDDFAVDNLSPGWRELELYDNGELVTRVSRLSNGSFTPDFESTGY